MHTSTTSDFLTPAELKAWRRVTDEQYQELLSRGMPLVHTADGVRHSKAEVYRWYFAVPPGAPNWITPKEIEDTLRVWQPYYRQLLTADDALEILRNVHNLLDVMFARKQRKEPAMPRPTRRIRKPPPHLRINLIGCGAIARWLLRPLLSYLHEHAEATFEVTVIDGEGDKARCLAGDALASFPTAVVKVIPEYLVKGNIAERIKGDDFVFVCVDNTATIKLISDHAVTLRDVTAMNGWCDWCDGGVHLHVRRNSTNLTPPFANKYRPEYLDPKFPNPGDMTPSERVPIKPEPKCIAATNMTAAVMVTLFHRVLKGVFGHITPEFAEYYLDANQGKVVGRVRME
jgi:hypothetical protein